MDRRSSDHLHQGPARNAEDLARLASSTDDPAARIWYLEWAKAFRRLALIHDPDDQEGLPDHWARR